MLKSEVITANRLPKELSKNSLLIFDRKLLKHDFFKSWSQSFSCLPVQGGEELKQIQNFPKYMEKIIKKTEGMSTGSLGIVVVGGGSVGDFGGFVASVLKRGVDLIQIPSTWLSAIDSAHGGKTALNVLNFKNQIGTFYPARQVYLVKELLMSQPDRLAKQGMGEMVKMVLIEGGPFYAEFSASRHGQSSDRLWRHLEAAVQAKWKVVKRDPFEKKGHRQVLNFGHTMGHFFEGYHGLSHGDAVGQGILFALDWGLSLGEIKQTVYDEVIEVMTSSGIVRRAIPKVSQFVITEFLRQDKKMDGKDHVRFIFMSRPGKVFVRSVPVSSVVQQAKTYGLVK